MRQFNVDRKLEEDELADWLRHGHIMAEMLGVDLRQRAIEPDHAPPAPVVGVERCATMEPYRILVMWVPFPVIGWNEVDDEPIYGDKGEWHLRVDTLAVGEPG